MTVVIAIVIYVKILVKYSPKVIKVTSIVVYYG